MRITLIQGDITAQEVDALVNPANSSLLGVGDEPEATSVAFPAVSAGIFGWPMDDAASQ